MEKSEYLAYSILRIYGNNYYERSATFAMAWGERNTHLKNMCFVLGLAVCRNFFLVFVSDLLDLALPKNWARSQIPHYLCCRT